MIGAAELWRAFDKTVEGGRWWLRRMRADGRPQSSGYGDSIFGDLANSAGRLAEKRPNQVLMSESVLTGPSVAGRRSWACRRKSLPILTQV